MLCTCHKILCRTRAMQAHSCRNWTKGTANWIKWRGTAVAERGPAATLHPIHYTVHERWAKCHKSVDRSASARDLQSTLAQGFVKHGFKVLLHPVVDGPLQASRYLVSRTPCVYSRYTCICWALLSMSAFLSHVAGGKTYRLNKRTMD